MIFFPLLVLFLPLVTLAETGVMAKCDDTVKVYKICQNQAPLLGTAMEKAKAEKKSVIVVFGADWCPWCLSLNKIFHEPTALRTLSKKYELLEVGIYAYDSKEKIPSGLAVLENVKKIAGVVKMQPGIPLLAIINPAKNKAAFIDTEPLEKNTKTTQGHHAEKVMEALEKTSARLL